MRTYRALSTFQGMDKGLCVVCGEPATHITYPSTGVIGRPSGKAVNGYICRLTNSVMQT